MERGNASTVQVTFKPFAFEGYDDEDKADAAMKEHVKPTLVEQADRVVAQTTNDGIGKLGAHMIVYVPPEFDSLLHIENKNGEVEVDFVGGARALEVSNKGAGDCLIAGAPSTAASRINPSRSADDA